MKRKTHLYLPTLVLFLITLPATGASASSATLNAPLSGPSAAGVYRFDIGDDSAKSIEFSASLDERGDATGQMTFRDQTFIPERDVDGVVIDDDKEETGSEFYLTASLDSLKVERNRAVMGGTITDSSHKDFVGRWVQLVVEDNGAGDSEPDKLSWQVFRPEEARWIPADAELKDDEGAWWKWWATDAEREDDAGVPSPNIIPGSSKGCPVFPLSSYEFAEVVTGEGDIRVSQ